MLSDGILLFGAMAAPASNFQRRRIALSDLKRIAVLMGGVSPEHDVSVRSGTGVMNALDPEHYDGLRVFIGKNGLWQVGQHAPEDAFDALPRLRDAGVDCVFIALHGGHGEDGRIQGMLDVLGLPYTGSGAAACSLAMDKVRCKAVVSAQGVRCAGHIALDRDTWNANPDAVVEAVQGDIGFPCVVKGSHGGSSLGVAVPETLFAFNDAVEQVLRQEGEIMIEQYVKGREVTCAVLDAEASGMIRPLPITEIIPKNKGRYWDYDSKYTPGATDEITPADLPPELASEVMDMAAHVHEIVGCRGWSRSDFMIGERGPVWLEVNTVPGLTETSLYPQAAAAAGIPYAKMVDLFIQRALRDAAAGE
ncbi:MAG: D-alanine--D-alanine ligase [Candidatus Hydrogenedens sp.]|nr:D-alanine--D-alanine ligase [Candidatus Hydrogenedens sp.]